MNRRPTPEEAERFMFDALVYQHIDLTGPWEGWKIRGRELVAPDKERIPVGELVGLLIHYRAKFGHHRARRRTAASIADQVPSNVVPFASAAVERLRARKKAEAVGVGAEPLRAP